MDLFGTYGFMNEFESKYRCYSISFLDGKSDYEKGGKVILPPSALEVLSQMNIGYPMLFKLTNKTTGRSTHCGVIEFIADEGKIYIPYWMISNLLANEGDILHVKNVTLSIGTFTKFQPHSKTFLDITNPKAVLENALRHFACLTTGDVIKIYYNDNTYDITVKETKPDNAILIIECDMQVDFDAPLDYVEPEKVIPIPLFQKLLQNKLNRLAEEENPFKGTSNCIKQKNKKKDNKKNNNKYLEKLKQTKGIPDYDYKIGTLIFYRSLEKD